MSDAPFDELAMTRAEWLEFRRSHVGGSDVAAIMGLSPWRTAYQAWAEKTGMAAPEDISDRPRVEWGTRLERDVAVKFSECHPDLMVAVPEVRDRLSVLVPVDRPWAMATLDGTAWDADGNPAVLEIKTAHWPTSRQWDDGVPAHYLAQVNHYLSVTGWDRAYVAVLVDGWDYREYEVERDAEDVAAVVEAVDAFWHGNVEAGVPPEVVADDSHLLASLHGEPGGDYPEGGYDLLELVEEWDEAKKRVGTAKTEVDNLAARIKAEIGDHAGRELPEGRIVWKRFATSRIDSKALREAEPDIYARFIRETVSQRLTWEREEA